jgi:hypothetical protein
MWSPKTVDAIISNVMNGTSRLAFGLKGASGGRFQHLCLIGVDNCWRPTVVLQLRARQLARLHLKVVASEVVYLNILQDDVRALFIL